MCHKRYLGLHLQITELTSLASIFASSLAFLIKFTIHLSASSLLMFSFVASILHTNNTHIIQSRLHLVKRAQANNYSTVVDYNIPDTDAVVNPTKRFKDGKASVLNEV